jgi:hypothetical protein
MTDLLDVSERQSSKETGEDESGKAKPEQLKTISG